ncbi:MAG TPA: CPBP family intramembrane metalloprotease [Clostridiaceae bacterium]|nr:CPBP family intramembrane metalloprotease [Clostridiaceae bacterium]
MKEAVKTRALAGIAVFFLLFIVQRLLGKAGYFISDMIPYQNIDPYDCFIRLSVHHAVMMLIAIIVIIVLSKLLKIDFYFKPGDVRNGMKYVAIFTTAFVVISVAVHVFLLLIGQMPKYDFPLDLRNIIGTLGFQMFLTGSTEEIVYRALAVTLLVHAFGNSIPVKGSITLEVVLASILFAVAHISWSLNPFVIEVNYFGILYAFVLGIIQGIVYQKCKSILYPVMMHSFSNILMVGTGYLFVALAT